MITFDAASNVSAGVVTGVTHAHTCTGSNRILFVAIQTNAATNVVTSITYAGVAMTLAASVHDTGNSSFLDIYYLVNPASGTNNVVIVNTMASVDVDCASYTGAAQSSQPDNTTTSLTGTGTTFTTTLTTVANNSWAVLFSNSSHGTVQSTASATLRTNSSSNVGLYDSNGPKTPAGSLSMQAAITGASSAWATVMVSFSPFVTATVNSGFFFAAAAQ